MSKLYKRCPTIVKLLSLDIPSQGLNYTIDEIFIKKLYAKSSKVHIQRFKENPAVFIISKNVIDVVKTIDIEAAKGFMTSKDLTNFRYDFILGNDIDGLLSIEITQLNLAADEENNLEEETSFLAFFNYFSGNGIELAMDTAHVGYVDLVNNNISILSATNKWEELGKFLMQLLIYMHFGDITSKTYAPKEDVKLSDNKLVTNTLKTPVTYLNTLWKQRVSTSGFKVKGHWRMQVHGINRRKKKLIWIESFSKSGYNRKATKELLEE